MVAASGGASSIGSDDSLFILREIRKFSDQFLVSQRIDALDYQSPVLCYRVTRSHCFLYLIDSCDLC